jgi:hypothetical protein
MDKVVLRYVGGGAFFIGVPARDLKQADLEERGLDFDELAASKLYEPVQQKTKKSAEATDERNEESEKAPDR